MAVALTLSNIGKNSLTLSSGELAKQANGSVCISYGETMVLATVCMSVEAKPDQDFFPLVVEYQAKTYAMGKIPGGFIKREGRPKDSEILSARLIDRPLRPLFPLGLTNEVQIVAMVLSSDGKNDPDVLAVTASSAALTISDIPFGNPVAAVRVAKINNEFVVNPSFEERDKASLDLVVVASDQEVVMLEGEGKDSSEEDVLAAIKYAHPVIRELIKLQNELKDKVGKKKRQVVFASPDQQLIALVREKVWAKLENTFGLVKKEEREEAIRAILTEVTEQIIAVNPEVGVAAIKKIFFLLEEEFVREKILKENKRPDARGLKDIRPIDCKTSVLARTHGSAVFTRGQTQALAITTLGTSSDEQIIEALEGEQFKHFMLHYFFPPFSVGEVKMMRGPSRRDIGHGALAEKALVKVLPQRESFPYTIRVVSEILESNGSSSMATVCAASLALMDAGVPLKSPIAGVAMGLVRDKANYKILTDIAGVEDHCGDMDFKVAGTQKGIAAIQLDIKIDGISYEIIQDTLQQAKQARLFILEKMNQALSLPRGSVSKYAPKIKSFKIDPEKIGAIIGPGGKIIRRLSRENNATIDIDDDLAMVSVVAYTQEELDRAVKQIVNLTKEIEVGEVFEGPIVRLMNFGAFCEIVPGKQGLIHVSELSDKYVKEVGEVVKEGDIVTVKVISIDSQGRINLSIKQAK
jgi:polyribonucleotide nucleotidyltransferase